MKYVLVILSTMILSGCGTTCALQKRVGVLENRDTLQTKVLTEHQKVLMYLFNVVQDKLNIGL